MVGTLASDVEAFEHVYESSILFHNMPKRLVEQVVAEARIQSCASGATIFSRDDRATHIYVVLDGILKLSRIEPSGQEAVVAIQEPGASIATALAFSGGVYPVNCTALSDSKVLAISNDTVRRVLLEDGEAMRALLAATYAHLHNLVDQVTQLKANSTTLRVARFLQGQCAEQKGRAVFDLPYDKGIIASVLGMTPETLSRSFNALRDQGIQVEGKRVVVESTEKLHRIVGK